MSAGGKVRRAAVAEFVRQELLAQFGSRCGYCAAPIDRITMSVDHVHPLHRGGTNDRANLLAACRSCNNLKSTYTVDEFRGEICARPDRLSRNAGFRLSVRIGLVTVNVTPVVFLFEKEQPK